MTSDVARFAQFCGKSYGVSESENALDNFVSLVGRNRREVYVAEIYISALSQRACATSVGVLNVRCGFTVKIEHLVVRENYVFDTVVPKCGKHHGTDADALCDCVFVFGIRVLFLNDFSRFSTALSSTS